MSHDNVVLSSEQKFQRRVEVVRVAKAQGPQQALIKFGIPLRTIVNRRQRTHIHEI